VSKRYWLIGVGAIIVVAVVASVSFRGEDKPQYFTSKADRGDIHEVVEATGTINASSRFR